MAVDTITELKPVTPYKDGEFFDKKLRRIVRASIGGQNMIQTKVFDSVVKYLPIRTYTPVDHGSRRLGESYFAVFGQYQPNRARRVTAFGDEAVAALTKAIEISQKDEDFDYINYVGEVINKRQFYGRNIPPEIIDTRGDQLQAIEVVYKLKEGEKVPRSEWLLPLPGEEPSSNGYGNSLYGSRGGL